MDEAKKKSAKLVLKSMNKGAEGVITVVRKLISIKRLIEEDSISIDELEGCIDAIWEGIEEETKDLEKEIS